MCIYIYIHMYIIDYNCIYIYLEHPQARIWAWTCSDLFFCLTFEISPASKFSPGNDSAIMLKMVNGQSCLNWCSGYKTARVPKWLLFGFSPKFPPVGGCRYVIYDIWWYVYIYIILKTTKKNRTKWNKSRTYLKIIKISLNTSSKQF